MCGEKSPFGERLCNPPYVRFEDLADSPKIGKMMNPAMRLTEGVGPYDTTCTRDAWGGLREGMGFPSRDLDLSGAKRLKHKKTPQLKLWSSFVLALTYLPGPSPDKYCRHW